MEKRNELVTLPHLSWSGPCPDREVEAYALAILVRLNGAGEEVVGTRSPNVPPSVLTLANLRQVARVYAYCRERIREERIRSYSRLLEMMGSVFEDEVIRWIDTHFEAIHAAEAELFDYVDTKEDMGFRCYG